MFSRNKLHLIFCLLLICISTANAVHPYEKQKIFYLNSYDLFFSTYEISLKAVKETFPPSDYILDVDFMDSKRFEKSEIYDNLKERIRIKLKQRGKYDMILVSDDNALLFALDNYQNLFQGTPIVFWGFEDHKKSEQLDSLNYVTGVTESILIGKTINLAKKIQRNLTDLVLISDNTVSGISDYNIYLSAKKGIADLRYHEYYTPDFTVSQLQDSIKKLDSHTAILKISAYNLKDSKLDLKEQYNLLFKDSPVPVYCVGTPGLEIGFTGGCLMDYYQHAVLACDMAKKVLNGADISTIKVKHDFPGENIISYQSMKKYNILSSSLPHGTIIYGAPSHLLNIRKEVFFFILSFLVVTLLLLGFYIRLVIIKRKLTNRLSISQQNYETLFRESPSINLLVDPKNGNIIDANNTALQFYGYNIDEIKRINIDQINALPQTDFKKKLEQTVRSRQSHEFTHKKKNGETRDVEVFTNQLFLENQAYLHTIIFDITDRLQAEEKIIEAKQKAEESDNLKSAFLANMSHEIRTPMNSILGFSDLLINDDISKDLQNEYLRTIYSNGEHLLSLINDIIDISKIEANQLKIILEEVNINELLDELYINFNNKRIKNNLLFDLKLQKGNTDNEFTIVTDRVRLRQILTNLIENAFKFTNNGFVQFGYKVRDDAMLQFFVKDSGIGIPKEKHDLIFSVFQRIEDSYIKNYSGAGLGLSITRSLVEKLGGHIWVMSDTGIGSRFYFTLPYSLEKKMYN